MASPSLARRDFRPRLTWNLPTRIPVPILTWNRLKLPAMTRSLMPSLHLVPRLSLKRNWLMITRPRLRGMTRLKEMPSRLPPPGAGAPPVRRQQRRRMGERTRPQSIRRRSNLILGSPRNSACRAGAASGWFPSTLSGRWRRIRTGCATTCWTWWSPSRARRSSPDPGRGAAGG